MSHDFKVSESTIAPAALQEGLSNPRAGAYVTFEGWVRNLNEDRPVIALEYEAFGALAEKEGARILAEARGKFEILQAQCIHRTGRLTPGELAVWVGVTAMHRGAAFDACRYIIDEVKARVPIWKKEHYAPAADGTAQPSQWINCAVRGDFVGNQGGPTIS